MSKASAWSARYGAILHEHVAPAQAAAATIFKSRPMLCDRGGVILAEIAADGTWLVRDPTPKSALLIARWLVETYGDSAT